MNNNVAFRCCRSGNVEGEKVIPLKSFTRFLIKLKFDCTMKLFERFNRRRADGLLTQSKTQRREILWNWKGFFKSINHELEGFQPWGCYRIPVDCLEPSIIQHSRFQIVCFIGQLHERLKSLQLYYSPVYLCTWHLKSHFKALRDKFLSFFCMKIKFYFPLKMIEIFFHAWFFICVNSIIKFVFSTSDARSCLLLSTP